MLRRQGRLQFGELRPFGFPVGGQLQRPDLDQAQRAQTFTELQRSSGGWEAIPTAGTRVITRPLSFSARGVSP